MSPISRKISSIIAFVAISGGAISAFIPEHVRADSATVTVTGLVVGCGDGVVEQGESCDGVDFGGTTCVSLGFIGGSLSCTATCHAVVSGCVSGQSKRDGVIGSYAPGTNSPSRAPELSNAVFFGTALPGAYVSLIKDGYLAATTSASEDGGFRLGVANISSGVSQFIVYAQKGNEHSQALSYVQSLAPGVTMRVDGVVLVMQEEKPEAGSSSVDTCKTRLKVGDVNCDNKIDLVDVSMLLAHFGVAWNKVDINMDGKIDIADFSILLSHWTL